MQRARHCSPGCTAQGLAHVSPLVKSLAESAGTTANDADCASYGSANRSSGRPARSDRLGPARPVVTHGTPSLVQVDVVLGNLFG